MTYISHSQNFEDYRLYRAFQTLATGYYIDIGAYDPIYHSVSYNFYEQGWRGVNVEPTFQSFSKLLQQRPNDINLQKFVTDTSSRVRLFVVPNSGLSTSNRDNLKAIENISSIEILEEMVEPISLNEVFGKLQGKLIHWLKIDVEGAEHEVLKSWGNNTCRPLVVVVEGTIPSSAKVSDHKWDSELISRGYLKSYFDGLNSFYCLGSCAEIHQALSNPISIFDDVIKYEEYKQKMFIQKILEIQIDWQEKDNDDFFGRPLFEKFINKILKNFQEKYDLTKRYSEILEVNHSLQSEIIECKNSLNQIQSLKIFRYSTKARLIWWQLLRVREGKFLILKLNQLVAFIMRREKLKKFVYKYVPITMLYKVKVTLNNLNSTSDKPRLNTATKYQDPKLEILIELLEGRKR